MKVGIVGLGLIGGSLARAYKRAGATVLGTDINKITADFVKLEGSCDGDLDEESMKDCDFILIAIPTGAAVEWLEDNFPRLPEKTTVIDCCGVKRKVCEHGFALEKKWPARFVGGHPMAGKQVGGFKNSAADMYDGAVFAIVPQDMNDIRLISDVKKFIELAGFSVFTVMTAEEHDKMIAFTSQMSHLISNAFIKSDMAMSEHSFVAGGSFRDMTRVADLDQDMWTELFLENRDNLLAELDTFLGELEEYKKALEDIDEEGLKRLLKEGKERKEAVEEEAAKRRK
jgi:prephenate dehydrogenase